MILAEAFRLFYNPVELGPNTALALVLPLCAAVGLGYKAVRAKNLRQLPLQVLWLWLQIVAGLVALGIVFYLLQAWS